MTLHQRRKSDTASTNRAPLQAERLALWLVWEFHSSTAPRVAAFGRKRFYTASCLVQSARPLCTTRIPA